MDTIIDGEVVRALLWLLGFEGEVEVVVKGSTCLVSPGHCSGTYQPFVHPLVRVEVDRRVIAYQSHLPVRVDEPVLGRATEAEVMPVSSYGGHGVGSLILQDFTEAHSLIIG